MHRRKLVGAIYDHSGYDSDPEEPRPVKRHMPHPFRPPPPRSTVLAGPTQHPDVYREQELKREMGREIRGMNARERHLWYVQNVQEVYEGQAAPIERGVTDADVLRSEYRFIRTDVDDSGLDANDQWGKQLARHYYDRLDRECCVAILGRWREGKVGLRWRSREEVRAGVGRESCGGCHKRSPLNERVVTFAYEEHGMSKVARVKVRLCDRCNVKMERAQISEDSSPASQAQEK